MSGITKNPIDLGKSFPYHNTANVLIGGNQKFVAAHHALGHAPTNFQKI